MPTKTLTLKELIRATSDGHEEKLEFQLGVNVIVGRPNTGKSKWLAMLDYLLGDGGQPEDAFGTDLAEKYDSISGIINIGGEDIHIERRWKEWGKKTKIIVNNDTMYGLDEFSDFILGKLGIPVLHYPKGSPYSGTWPVLSWRVLFRHIYRQQRFWSDFADKQPEVDQHACLMLFLGIAEYLYSDKYGELVKMRKKIFQLEAMKDEFQKILDDVSKDLIDEAEVGVGVTAQSIGTAIRRLENETKSQQEARDASLRNLLSEIVESTSGQEQSELERLSEAWTSLQMQVSESQLLIANLNERLLNLTAYHKTLTDETDRINRADKAGKLLTGLKITHCPACDQPVHEDSMDTTHCFLCHQTLPEVSNTSLSGTERLKLETSHLKAEQSEINDLISSLSKEKDLETVKHRRIVEQIKQIDQQLNSVRRMAASIVSPDISLYDMEIGRLQERIRQLNRIRSLLDYRENITQEIDGIMKELADLEADVNHLMRSANFGNAEDTLSDGMTTYLNALNTKERTLWDLGRVTWQIKERSFDVQIRDSNWTTKLGGTLTLYFLIAYHFALLNLTGGQKFHYPGLAILDFQAKLDDGTIVKDQENFILEPFGELLRQPHMQESQVIAAGAAFDGLKDANRIELEHIWA